MQEVALSILRGIRNGSYYGTKIRAPHGTWWRHANRSLHVLYACQHVL